MNDATLIILAWHRPAYLQQCLESWGRARGARDLLQVTVRLGRSSAPVESQMRQIATKAAEVYRLRLKVVLDDPEDALAKGPDRALGSEISASFADPACGFVIECDEDVIVSDDILDYFAWARRTQDVAAVCAHNDLGQGWSAPLDDTAADQSAVRVYGEFTSWCWGTSRAAWEAIWLPEWDWDRTTGTHMAQHGWEWQMHRQAAAGLRVAIPDASRCQNIGRDGGTFSQPGHFAGTQAASFRAHRAPVYRLVAPEVTR